MDKPVVSSSKPHMRWDRKNALVGLAVLVVLAVAGALLYVAQRDKEPVSKVPQYSQQQLVEEVNMRYGNNDYVGAIRLIEGQKTINETSTQLLLAGAYANSSDNKKAMEIYDKLEAQNKLNEAHTATAAEIAERLKDYQKAIALYKKAKARADQKAVDQLAVYDYKIAELEKKQ